MDLWNGFIEEKGFKRNLQKFISFFSFLYYCSFNETLFNNFTVINTNFKHKFLQFIKYELKSTFVNF